MCQRELKITYNIAAVDSICNTQLLLVFHGHSWFDVIYLIPVATPMQCKGISTLYPEYLFVWNVTFARMLLLVCLCPAGCVLYTALGHQRLLRIVWPLHVLFPVLSSSVFCIPWQDNSTHLWSKTTHVCCLSELQAHSLQTQAGAGSSARVSQRLRLGQQPSCIAFWRLGKQYSEKKSKVFLLRFVWGVVGFGTHSNSDLRPGQSFPVLRTNIIRIMHTHICPE